MTASAMYCDYNATAPLRPVARDALMSALDVGANPSSVHAAGRQARALVDRAREHLAASLDSTAGSLIFTSGGTEAIASALWGARAADPRIEVWAAATEHEAVIAQNVARVLPVDSDGLLSLDVLDAEMSRANGCRPLLCLMNANNVTGTIQQVADAAAILHAGGGLIHCDAVQAFGKIPISVRDLDVDYLSVSAHKIGGPHGVGALHVRDGAPFSPRQSGGGQEMGRRSGTENLSGIAGFGAAAIAATASIAGMAAMAGRRNAFETRLRRAVPDVRIHSAAVDRLANTSCFGLSGLGGQSQMMRMDLAGIAVSAGSACSSGRLRSDRVLRAMGMNEADALSAIRVSLGWASRDSDWDALADAWIAMVRSLRPEACRTSTDAAGAADAAGATPETAGQMQGQMS